VDTHYHGILIRAAGNVHTHVAERLFALKPPPARVLDIAAGNGALTARLIDAGYDLTASDLNPSPFELDIPCTHVNLDDPFAEKLGGPYDAIVAIDVIEHLESPSAFLRGCAELLAPDGVLIVSTPNLESAASRVSFLTRGCPSWFGREEALGERHISPQLPWFMEANANRARLEITDEWCTDPALAVTWGHSFKNRLLYNTRVLRWIERRWDAEGGDVRIFVLRHAPVVT
jgi:SAM-dependent methyltransferase